uniref:Mas-related G protein-coupled receptor D n=1 Tax=Macaca mulatta TaxID=9544 RepID=W8W3E5_MACMU|nr:TPA: Mas-related G protein-coupled receptor D [Macaca mulatta]
MVPATQNFTLVHLPLVGMNQTLNSSGTAELALNHSRGSVVHAACLVLSSLAMFTCLCGMAGNSMVIWLLGFRMRRTPFSIYILNLAVADLLFVFSMAAMLSLETQPLVSTTDKVHELMKRLKYFAYTVGLSLRTAISTQRCLSVLFPIWFKCHRPRHLSAWVCALLWMLCLLTNGLTSCFCSKFLKFNKDQCFRVDMVQAALIMGVLTPVMTLSSLTLFVRVRRSSQQWRRQPTRLFVVVLASVLVFLICSLPLGFYWFVLYWLNLPPDTKVLYFNLSRLSSSMSSSANPLIYFLVGSRRSRRLQGSLGTVLQRALREEPELEGGETPTTGTNEMGA